MKVKASDLVKRSCQPCEGRVPPLEAEAVYTTHAIGGLSENDFVCAAKIDRL